MEDKCCKCDRGGIPLYRPAYDDGTYHGECGRCIMNERDKYRTVVSRIKSNVDAWTADLPEDFKFTS